MINEKITEGFLLIKESYVDEIKSKAYEYIHLKSGAKLLAVKNEDKNKVFSITFKTPPKDSTGVAHILEHSVLCGSRKFPLKEPFVELVKGSLNTFLNAMTFPDKTMYPVASQNTEDFFNLIDVYLDAVFYPNIYQEENILKQEGWHYELENISDDLNIKGVVYNEMKGVFSSPDGILQYKVQEALYPDTPYGVESGGDPEFIPNLTNDNFKEFHKSYYHPANSYIYLYGDGDLEQELAFLDKNYLSDFEKIAIDVEILKQKAFSEQKRIVEAYSIAADEEIAEKGIIALNYVIGSALDAELVMGMQILSYMLLESQAAPLRRALMELELGKDVYSNYEESILQPVFSIVAKDIDLAREAEFLLVIENTMKKIVLEGFDTKLLEAAINSYEFSLREANAHGLPLGLLYGITVFNSWLYGGDPLEYLRYEEVLASIKKKSLCKYFENLVEQYFLHNDHSAVVCLKPEKNLSEQRDNEQKIKLEKIKKAMSDAEITSLLEGTEKIKLWQQREDSKEALASIPQLPLSAIDAKPQEIVQEIHHFRDVQCLFHPQNTRGIIYLNCVFETDAVSQADIPYLSLLMTVLKKLSTDNYDFTELTNELNIHTGGLCFKLETIALDKKEEEYKTIALITSKALTVKIDKLLELILQIITKTKFNDNKRLLEIIKESRSHLSLSYLEAGHHVAGERAGSYCSQMRAFGEKADGLEYFKWLTKLEKNFQKEADDLALKLAEVCSKIFCSNKLLLSFTAEESDKNEILTKFDNFVSQLPLGESESCKYEFVLENKDEALVVPSEVQYVAISMNYASHGFNYHGSMQVLRNVLSKDYLWNNVRVLGGAYGAMVSIDKRGLLTFMSYRDPNIEETLAVYRGAAEYLRNFKADIREMEKYIIGTFSKLDMPLTPQMYGERGLVRYLTKTELSDLEKERLEILQTTTEQIRHYANLLQVLGDKGGFTVLGSALRIAESEKAFSIIVNVFE